MRINVTDRQLHKYFKCMETFRRFDPHFNQNFMGTSILFVLRPDRDFSAVIIEVDESRGIVNFCTLYVAASFLPRLLFIVKVEGQDENYFLVDIYRHMV